MRTEATTPHLESLCEIVGDVLEIEEASLPRDFLFLVPRLAHGPPTLHSDCTRNVAIFGVGRNQLNQA